MLGPARPSKKIPKKPRLADRALHESYIARRRPTQTSADTVLINPEAEEVLCLNIGGVSYRIKTETILCRRSYTFLYDFVLMGHAGRLLNSDGYIEQTNEYFFERSAPLFDAVYGYFVSGVCHKPKGVCADEVLAELGFWGVPRTAFAQCCWPGFKDEALRAAPEQQFSDQIALGKTRKRIWNFLENPSSSASARLFTFFSVFIVFLSNFTFVLSSIPEFQVRSPNHKTRPFHVLQLIEGACMVFFTVEYVLKFLVATDRRRFFFGAFNLIDISTLAPFYLELVLDFGSGQLGGAFVALRTLRVFRVFKLGKHSDGMRAFGRTLKRSFKQLCMIATVIATLMLFFSVLVYFMENESNGNTKFSSIPSTLWWSIVTLSSEGYGDMVPATTGGQLLAVAVMCCGVLIMSIPITIIVDNYFVEIWHTHN